MPNSKYNLFSVTQRLNKGWKIGGDKMSRLFLEKGEKKIVFDIMIEAGSGVIACMYLKRSQNIANVTTANNGNDKLKASSSYSKSIPIKLAHDLFGHCDEARTRKMAEAQGFKITRGTLGPCEACAAGKAKQKNVIKESKHDPANDSNERIFLDISSVRPKKDMKVTVTKPNWRIMVDERTQMKWSQFFRTKNGMIEPTCVMFYKWKQSGKPVKYLRMDNSGENKKLEERMNGASWKLNIDPEYTAASTPQQNHLAELSFHILANRGRALMHRANVPLLMRYKLFREAFTTVTQLDWLAVIYH